MNTIKSNHLQRRNKREEYRQRAMRRLTSFMSEQEFRAYATANKEAIKERAIQKGLSNETKNNV